MPIKQKIAELTEELVTAIALYYRASGTKLSDYEFDMKLKELQSLELQHPQYRLPHSPVGRVGSDLDPAFNKVRHDTPVLSIENAYTFEEVQEFMSSVQKVHPEASFVADMKIDGLSMSVHYMDGHPVQAVTRGDGHEGDDVTENARVIVGLPLVISEQGAVEVRGEVYMPHASFAAYNSTAVKPFANPRSAATGTLKSKDVLEVARRGLRFRAFRVISDALGVLDQTDQVKSLKSLGFETNPTATISTIEDFITIASAVGVKRKGLGFDIDGVVLKVQQADAQSALGDGSKYINWAIAYKYPAESVSTVLESITLQVGRTGRITPVAELTAVHLAGTTVRRATLHNFEEIERLGLHYGDTVCLEKGGEIIPKITGVDISERPESSQPVELPTVCPACGAPLEKGDDADIRCVSISCPPQHLRRITHFVSRPCMNIEDLGPSLVLQLIDLGIISAPLDIYRIGRSDLLRCQRMGEKSATKIYEAIQASKSAGGERLLFALGVRHVGKGTSKDIMTAIGDLTKLWGMGEPELMEIQGNGPETVASILQWVSGNPGLPQELAMLGLTTTPASGAREGSAFEGETVVFTGVMEHMERGDAQDLVERLGGSYKSSVSKKTTLLVAGKDAGSKVAKATELGVAVLSEQEFLNRAGVSAVVKDNRKATVVKTFEPTVELQYEQI